MNIKTQPISIMLSRMLIWGYNIDYYTVSYTSNSDPVPNLEYLKRRV